MKIIRVTPHHLSARLSQPFAYSRSWYDRREALLVEVETDGGLTGWGECYGPPRLTGPAVAALGERLAGADPLAVEALRAILNHSRTLGVEPCCRPRPSPSVMVPGPVSFGVCRI